MTDETTDETTVNSGETDRHNVRIDKTLWGHVQDKLRRLNRAGYVSPAYASRELGARRNLSTTEVIAVALEEFLAEDDASSVARLRLRKTEGE